MSASTGAAASWRERGTGASVLVAGISSAFGVLILTGVGYLTAIISADPTVGDVRAVQYTLSILGTVILGVSVFVAAVVTANTFATIVAGRTRQIALMRLIGSSARTERRRVTGRGLAVGAVGAVAGLVAGIGLSYVLVAVLRGYLSPEAVSGVTYRVLQPSLLVPAGVVVLTTWAAAWVGSRRVLTVTPLQALASSTDRTTADVRHPVRTVISFVAIGIGAALLAAGIVVGFADPGGMVVAFFGGVVSFTGIVVGSVVLMPPVLRLTGRAFGSGVTARMAAQNALRYPERSARMTIGVVIGVTLVTLLSVASESTKAVLASASGGTLDPGLDEAMNVTSAIMMSLVGVSAVIAAVGLVNLLTIGIVQRRRELGLLRSLGLSRPQANRMVLLEATHVAFTAVVVGVLLGIGYGWAAAQSMLGSVVGANVEEGHTLVLPAVPWLTVAVIAAAAAVLTLAAAAVPSRLATRVSPVEALAAT